MFNISNDIDAVFNMSNDIDAVFNISHDIIAHATTQNQHLQVFDKIREKGLKLNLKKCEFG